MMIDDWVVDERKVEIIILARVRQGRSVMATSNMTSRYVGRASDVMCYRVSDGESQLKHKRNPNDSLLRPAKVVAISQRSKRSKPRKA